MHLLRRIMRKVLYLRETASMRVLYGTSLGWNKLPTSPQITKGSIFNECRSSLPWFTYPAIAQLLRIGIEGEKILEYGSGSSTSFFLEKGCIVKSIEDDENWAGFVRSKIGSSSKAEIILKDVDHGYVQSSQQLAAFGPSVVLIDGKNRRECAAEVADYLLNHENSKTLWMVILDNSDWHGASYSILANCDEFVGLDYYGHGPYNSYSWCTSLFVRSNSIKFLERMKKAGPAKPMQNGLASNWSDKL